MATGKTFREFPAAALDAIAADVAGRAGKQGNAVTFAPEHPDVAGRALALPVATGAGRRAAWLVAVRDGGPLGDVRAARSCSRP